jgi:hypothetical protein
MSIKTPEGKVKEQVKIILNAMGAYYAMPHGAGYGNAGIPDFVVCWKGRFIGIECKANGKEATALQLHNLMQIRKAGGRALIINEDSVIELRKELERE